MRNNVRLLQLMAMLICVLFVVGASSTQSLLKTNAQNAQISPQYGCLGPCTSGTPSGTQTNGGNGTNSSISGQPATPSSAISTSPQPTTQPCLNNSLTSLSPTNQSTDQISEKGDTSGKHRGQGGHHQDGGFLKDIFQLLLLMMDVLLKLSGGGINTPCPPTVTPTVSPSPSVPVASASPVVSTIPSSSPTISSTPSNPGTINTSSGLFGGGPFGNNCNPGQLYCNDHAVSGGKNNTLYTCEPHGPPTIKQACPGACKVNASGNDAC